MVTIYVLKLANYKYYVGSTNINKSNMETLEYFQLNLCDWTKLYKPLGIVDVYENCIKTDENIITKLNMKKYGIDNVRGGSFSKIMLFKIQKDDIRQEFNELLNKSVKLLSNNLVCKKCNNNYGICCTICFDVYFEVKVTT